jgi:hypothetical protein
MKIYFTRMGNEEIITCHFMKKVPFENSMWSDSSVDCYMKEHTLELRYDYYGLNKLDTEVYTTDEILAELISKKIGYEKEEVKRLILQAKYRYFS